MMLQALLVSKDDQTAETLIHVLAQLGAAVVRSSAAEAAVARLNEASFDLVLADFEDPETASLMLESCRQLVGTNRNLPVTIALLADARQIRVIVGSGAHFVLTKPVSPEQALATLSAATAILKRERRQAPRVAVQVPVSDPRGSGQFRRYRARSEHRRHGCTPAKPVSSSCLVVVLFDLPDGLRIEADAEVAWSTANGQIGLRFLEMDSKIREQLGEWLKSHSTNSLPEESLAIGQCKLTDLSLGGCYVESESPFPQSSAVDLCLKAAGMELHAEGLVRVMHPSHGMGIEFPARTEDQRKGVADFIECLTGNPGAHPELEISPRALVANAADFSQADASGGNAEDPLVELLRTGGGMDQEEFLSELSRQRTPADVSR